MKGERQRQMLLEALKSSRDGLDTSGLADHLGLHPNTIRWHLGILGDAGLVEAIPERQPGRGRPHVVYRLTGEGMVRGRDEFRLLATILTDVVADGSDGEPRAYEAGVLWGRNLHQGDPDAGIVRLLDQEGFAAELHGDRLEMRHCPFYALAERSPQVICTLHRGIIDGALAEAGSKQAVERLDPFVEPSLCVARLRAAS